MRGSPPFQLSLLLLGFFALGVPLVQLTSGKPAMMAKSQAPSDESHQRPVLLRLRYVTAPAGLSIQQGGKELLTSPLTASPAEIRTTFPAVLQNVELHVQAKWQAGSPEMPLTLEVEPDALDTESRTLWSIDGQINDTLSFTWKS